MFIGPNRALIFLREERNAGISFLAKNCEKLESINIRLVRSRVRVTKMRGGRVVDIQLLLSLALGELS